MDPFLISHSRDGDECGSVTREDSEESESSIREDEQLLQELRVKTREEGALRDHFYLFSADPTVCFIRRQTCSGFK